MQGPNGLIGVHRAVRAINADPPSIFIDRLLNDRVEAAARSLIGDGPLVVLAVMSPFALALMVGVLAKGASRRYILAVLDKVVVVFRGYPPTRPMHSRGGQECSGSSGGRQSRPRRRAGKNQPPGERRGSQQDHHPGKGQLMLITQPGSPTASPGPAADPPTPPTRPPSTPPCRPQTGPRPPPQPR